MDPKQNIDELSQERLDLEFQRILRIIRPYIPYIMNNYYLTLYKMWLEKLSELGLTEKEERNRYLIELCHQIQDGILEQPFTQLPPLGPLPPFKNRLQDEKVTLAKQLLCRNTICNHSVCAKNPAISQKDLEHWNNNNNNSEIPTLHKERNQHTIFKNIQNQNSLQTDHEALEDVSKSSIPFLCKSDIIHEQVAGKDLQRYITSSKQNHYSSDHYFKTQGQSTNKGKTFCQQLPQSAENELSFEHIIFCQKQQLRQSTSQQNSIDISGKNGDYDSSWNELADVSHDSSTTNVGSGDLDDTSTILKQPGSIKNHSQNNLYEMYDARIADLMSIITELQKQNLSLNEDVAKYERDLSLRNSNTETNIYNLAGEVKSLINGLRELSEIKSALKNSYFTASLQWQNTINTLNNDLCVAQNKNLTLELEVNKLKEEIENLSSQQQKDDVSLKQTLCDMHAEDIKILKEDHAKHIEIMENKFVDALTERENEFSCQQRDLKMLYESKVFDIINEYDKKIILNRSAEMPKHKNTTENQSKSMEEEVREIGIQTEEYTNPNSNTNLKKIAFLQRCLRKIDHLFKKSEKKYNKHILKLKHEIYIRDRALQIRAQVIQLTTQRAELLATTNTKTQVETDATVLLLEERYRKLLETQQAHFLSEKQNDAKLIAELRATLGRKNVANYPFSKIYNT